MKNPLEPLDTDPIIGRSPLSATKNTIPDGHVLVFQQFLMDRFRPV